MTELLTISDISFRTKRSQQALNKNKRVQEFLKSERSNGGRNAKLYDPRVLEVFGIKVNECDEDISPMRKSRSDKGGLRGGRKKEVVEYLERLAFTEYMSDATQDIRSACHRAVKKMYELVEKGLFPATVADVDVCAKSEWLYFNYINRSNKTRASVAQNDGWAICHREKWHKWDSAIGSGHNRYTFWKIAENSLDCGQGRGRGRFVMLDDRKTDVWTANTEGGFSMVYAIYAWDTLTGELLWVEQAAGDGVSGNDYVRCILGVVYRCGNDCPIWFLENSRSAKANFVSSAINLLYDNDDKQFLASQEVLNIFKNQAPIVRNTAHIPRDIGKSIGERLFGHVKRWDSLLYPQSYHGSGINESVQLQTAVLPTLGDYTPSSAEYFNNLLGSAYDDYLDRDRSALKEWGKTHGRKPNRRSMIEYYTPERINYPSAHQTALLLYYAITDRHTVKYSDWGVLRCQINNRMYNLRADELGAPGLFGKKLTIVPVPGRDGECAIYDATREVKFVCVAKDFTGTDASSVHRIRVESREIRENARASVRAFTEQKLLTDPVQVANARRKPTPELPSPAAPATVTYTEVINPESDTKVLKNLHTLY